MGGANENHPVISLQEMLYTPSQEGQLRELLEKDKILGTPFS